MHRHGVARAMLAVDGAKDEGPGPGPGLIEATWLVDDAGFVPNPDDPGRGTDTDTATAADTAADAAAAAGPPPAT